MSAMIGILSSALLISVLAQKLLLNRWEKYVHNFVLNIELAKTRKHEAANVIKFAMRVWFLKRKNKTSSMHHLKAQWKLFRSIHTLQEVKHERRKLVDGCLGLADVFNLQRTGDDRMETIGQDVNAMKQTIDQWEHQLSNLNQTMSSIQHTLSSISNRRERGTRLLARCSEEVSLCDSKDT